MYHDDTDLLLGEADSEDKTSNYIPTRYDFGCTREEMVRRLQADGQAEDQAARVLELYDQHHRGE